MEMTLEDDCSTEPDFPVEPDERARNGRPRPGDAQGNMRGVGSALGSRGREREAAKRRALVWSLLPIASDWACPNHQPENQEDAGGKKRSHLWVARTSAQSGGPAS